MWSTNPLERVNKEIKRRSDVVGVFLKAAALLRLAGSVLIEQHDEWEAVRAARYLGCTHGLPLSDLLALLREVRLESGHPGLILGGVIRVLASHRSPSSCELRFSHACCGPA
ncbi:hypothetical protein E3O65_15940 [Cryobacterium breve]|uniref:Mutator family transposase n=1 Tax=Cryobacterium breve TaxID=1259258 RepID=A0ABY2IWW3_9MICO|nr:hypothetical protein E3T20_08050 [Cryobacterium sp. TmT3-12]TFC95046.1 hypothetical protein E3O65_15940 [Cryobacterium breve]